MNRPDLSSLLPPPDRVPAVSVSEVKLLVATAKARNAEVVGQVVDESIEASARARQQREADEAERRAEEARQARLDEIERREREEAEAVSAEKRRVAAEIAARAEEDKARLAETATPTLLDGAGRLDASA